MKQKIINIIITLIIGFIVFYITLPAINFTNPGFYVFLSILFAIFGILEMGSNTFQLITKRRFNFKFNTILFIPIIFILISIINFFFSPLFISKNYANRITIDETENFNEGIKEVDFNKTPLLDKDSSIKLGNKVMGEMREFVSQYHVSNLYTQINYNNDIIRVTPLEYADLIKCIVNRKHGVKGYITVNSVNGESKVVKLKEGMKYIPSAILNKDLMRHLRFNYPTLNFGSYTFELDDKGNPYYIVPFSKYTSVGLKEEIVGIVLVNPFNGKTTKYKVEDVPTWVDHVYNANLIIEQTDDWGTYQGGFWNSVFSQKNVVNTTQGYNYLAMDNDIYLYTGITSIQSDQSNLGFILSNLRTKETKYYSVSGAEEFSAQESAEGQVQEMKYKATFPLLINLNGRATYLMSLKDDAGLVKKYAFVDVADYQKVSVTDSSKGIDKAAKDYLNSYKMEIPEEKYLSKEIKIESIKTTTIDGNTVYYYIDNDKNKYMVNINISKEKLPFIKVGDTLKVKYIEAEINIIKEVN